MTTATLPDLSQVTLDKVPPLPGAVIDLIRSFDDKGANTAELARKIGQDPVLSARVIRIANSPFFGVAGQISSLQEAVMVLGFSNVRSLALAASLTGGFPARCEGGIDPCRLWRHSFCCALCAQALAKSARVDAGAAFTAGLLHDIGRLTLACVEPQRFAEAVAARRNHTSLVAAERAILGFTHAELGARLLSRWRLPESLVHAVAFHHRPDTEPTSRLTDLVHVADILAHATLNETLDRLITTGTPDNAFVRLGLTRTQCAETLAGIGRQLEAFDSILN